MNNYRFENEKFIIEKYDEQKPFASFLPGVAGIKGIPMWVYYTNRGQGIAGFGVENKDGAIMDFVPANMAYKRTELTGYRTFIKKNDKVHEIFSSMSNDRYKRRMIIENNSVSFVEENETLEIKITVKYFTSTDEDYPALIRKVDLEPLNDISSPVEIIDGLMTLWPYQNNNFVIKNMSNLAVAWFEVLEDHHMMFYKNRSTTEDSASVGSVDAGHFYCSYFKEKPVPVIYDPELLFGYQTSNLKAQRFEKKSLNQLLSEEQVAANKLPCAFSAVALELKEKSTLFTVIGKMLHYDELLSYQSVFNSDYFMAQEEKAQLLGEKLTADVKGKTAYPMFDAYVKQSYLDNLLRGGYPIVFKGEKEPIVYHVFSRIHGDMEREYNDFYVEPAYYSHGLGNYRDVNQNRRNDVYFVKEAGLYNIKQFMELIQMDGQNPLSIQGSKIKVKEKYHEEILSKVLTHKDLVKNLLQDSFTPGAVLMTLKSNKIKIQGSEEKFLESIIGCGEQTNEAAYGHGFWVDHWTYNMDLVENYLNVYPENLEALMFDLPLRYFISPEVVLKRKEKYVLNEKGEVRQYHGLFKDDQRIEKLKLSYDSANWHKKEDQTVFVTDLFTKLLILTLNKVSSFDPSGIGIMMNSDKPGWNDAMNGLPGLFGSGTSEVAELNRIVQILKTTYGKLERNILVPKSVKTFIETYLEEKRRSTEATWSHIQDAKERFDDENYDYMSEKSETLTPETVKAFLVQVEKDIDESIHKGIELGHGVLVTFLIHEAETYDMLDSKHPVIGLQNVHVKTWKMRPLPLFLEAPARYLKQLKNKEEASKMANLVLNSELYDEKLKMYVTSASLESESYEIGRARAFTAGWLERESVFMHMSYKYLLGLLKSGLYQEYFDSIQTAFPPFMKPEVYGRSTLENSSFIASSRNPDHANHGRGFVSRLTGTTSELISMWLFMMTGSKIFSYDHTLEFHLNPILEKSFFDENNQVRSRIFGTTELVYHNPTRKNTFGEDGVKVTSYTLTYEDGSMKTMMRVLDKDAYAIRNQQVKQIDIALS
ncbi:MAG: cellobiose phosphorylase [Clostridia bacterium]|nr:cellobiose phosphorylase [Clostridia bacterium]